MRSAWASKSPGCAVLPASSMLAVPETWSATLFVSTILIPRAKSEPYSVASLSVGAVITVRAAGRPLARRTRPGRDRARREPARRRCRCWPAPDRSPRLEERAPRAVQAGVVPVDVAQMDPRAHDVAELHARLLQQVFGDTEHGECLLVGVLAEPVETARVERASSPTWIRRPWERRTRHSRRRTGPRTCRPAAVGPLGRTACTETSRQARSFSGGCSISVVAGRWDAPAPAREHPTARRTNPARSARRLRRKSVSQTTDAKLPPSASRTPEDRAIDRLRLLPASAASAGGWQRKKSSRASGPSTRRRTIEQPCVWIVSAGEWGDTHPHGEPGGAAASAGRGSAATGG